MGLFDNLFKSKPTPGEEAVIEAARRITETEKAKLLEAEKAGKPVAQKAPGSGNRAAHAPVARAYSPRSLGQAVPPARPIPGKGPAKAIRFGAEGGRPQEIRLVLDDILPRIPPEILSDAPRDGRKEVRFRVEDVSADIARGRAAVALGRIAQQAPEIFKSPISHEDETLIRLPLQKLVEQIGFLPVRPAAEAGSARTTQALLPGALKQGGAGGPVGPGLREPLFHATPMEAHASGRPPEAPQTAVSDASERRVASEPPVPAPEFQSAGIAADAKISLSLVAILRECPKELICAPLPPIKETDRISIAFSPIEKQLKTGQVEISSVRFVFALPTHLQHCFEAREGIRIPLPLDEVLRNLPGVNTPQVAEGEADSVQPEADVADEQPGSTPPVPESSPTSEGESSLSSKDAGEQETLDVTPPSQSSDPTGHTLAPPEGSPILQPEAVPDQPVEISDVPEAVAQPESPHSPLPEPPSEPTLADIPGPSSSEYSGDTLKANVAPEDETLHFGLGTSPLLESASQDAGQDAVSNEGDQSSSPISASANAPAWNVPEMALPPPEISITLPQGAFEAPSSGENQQSASDADRNQPVLESGLAEPQYPLSPGFLPSPAPPPLATILPPPIISGIPTTETPAEVANGEIPPTIAPEAEASVPVRSQFVPPRVQLGSPPAPLRADDSPSEALTAPEAASATQEAVESPALPSLDPAASPFVAPPVFPVPPPVLMPGGPPAGRETPHIDPPQSPMLPVRLVSPVVLRPVVAPPPLFGAGLGEGETVPESVTGLFTEEPAHEQAPLPPPLPPPPAPLNLAKASETLGLPSDVGLHSIGQALTRLPGIHACLLTVRHETADVGELPDAFSPSAARALARRLADSLGEQDGISAVQHLTVFAADGCLSIFARGNAVLCALHRTRAFLPGVCEKLSAAAEALGEA